MKKRAFLCVVYVLAFAVTAINVFFSLKNYLFADINDLPTGTLITHSASPTGERVVSVYLVKNTMGKAIRAEVFTNGEAPKTIYWQTGIDEADVSWYSENVVYVNDIALPSSGKYHYDCRRGTSLFAEGTLADRIIGSEE